MGYRRSIVGQWERANITFIPFPVAFLLLPPGILGGFGAIAVLLALVQIIVLFPFVFGCWWFPTPKEEVP